MTRIEETRTIRDLTCPSRCLPPPLRYIYIRRVCMPSYLAIRVPALLPWAVTGRVPIREQLNPPTTSAVSPPSFHAPDDVRNAATSRGTSGLLGQSFVGGCLYCFLPLLVGKLAIWTRRIVDRCCITPILTIFLGERRLGNRGRKVSPTISFPMPWSCRDGGPSETLADTRRGASQPLEYLAALSSAGKTQPISSRGVLHLRRNTPLRILPRSKMDLRLVS